MSLSLEFIALIVLRIKEPTLRRPFKVPGGMAGAILVGVCPALLLGFSIVHGESEQILGMSGLTFGLLLIGGGFLAYWLKSLIRPQGWAETSTLTDERKAA